MKKSLFLILLSACMLTGCKTALQFSNNAHRRSFDFGHEPMEFLGFKNSYTTDSEFLDKKPFFQSFGNKIEGFNIAVTYSFTILCVSADIVGGSIFQTIYCPAKGII